MCTTNWGPPVPVSVAAGLGTGALAGVFNGTAIAKMKIPPFIATLGTMMIARGLSLVISGVAPIYVNDTPSFGRITMGSAVGQFLPNFTIPNAVLILFGAAIVASTILTKTILGRYTVALAATKE